MGSWSFDRVSPALNGVGMAEAKEETLDIDQLAEDLDESHVATGMLLEQLDRAGLVWLAPAEEPEDPPMLTRAGSQYLELRGQVSHEVLFFLSAVIDDLYARRALIHGGTVLIDEFRYEPADAAMAGHSPLNRKLGVLDQRLEAWFHPFGGVAGTGHLDERTEEGEESEDE